MTYKYKIDMTISIEGAEDKDEARAVVDNIIDHLIDLSFNDNMAAGEMTWVPEFPNGVYITEEVIND